MPITVKNNAGATLSEIDCGFGNTLPNLTVTVTPTNTTQDGRVLIGGVQIGQYSHNPTRGTVVTWFSGGAETIPIQKGQVLSLVATNPVGDELHLPITRVTSDDLAQPALAANLKLLGNYTTAPVRNRIKAVADAVAAALGAQPLSLKADSASNLKHLRDLVGSQAELPPLELRLYPNASTLVNDIDSYVPPTKQQIFNGWDRFTGNNQYFPQGVGAVAPASDWYWDAATERAVMPTNTTAVTGFVSDIEVERYRHDVILGCTNGSDNDYIVVILAFKREGSVNQYLSLALHTGGDTSVVPYAVFEGTWGLGNGNTALVHAGTAPTLNTNWASNWRRVYIERNGDIFRIQTGNFNQMDLLPSTLIEFDLKAHSRTQKFVGPCKYGYATLSQPNSYFEPLSFTGGVQRDIAIDAATGTVYRHEGSVWQEYSDTRLWHLYAQPRRVISTYDQSEWWLENNTLTLLVPGIEIPDPDVPPVPGPAVFHGEVATASLIDGATLAHSLGLTAGYSVYDTQPWLHFTLDGKQLYVAKKPYRTHVTWRDLELVNAVYGNRQVIIGSNTYKVRLLKGANADPAPLTATFDPPGTHGSEWNRLFYHIHSGIHRNTNNTLASEGIITGDLAQYSDADLLVFDSGPSGNTTWCQETVAGKSAERVCRGFLGVSAVYLGALDHYHEDYGWRPVLELVE